MFVFKNNLKLTFVSKDFINTHSLPSMNALQDTSIITMLAFIVSPVSESDHNVIWATQTKLQALRPSEELTYIMQIANQRYEVSFRAVSNYECIGGLKRLEKLQPPSKENKNAGGLLRPSIAKNKNTAMPPKPNSLQMNKPQFILTETSHETLPRILVVDDSEVNREVAGIFLTPDFPLPLYAKNGFEALEILRCEQVDLILMDIHMPDMNGVEATIAIREADTPWSNVIIIALTADTAYQSSRVYKNIGMDDAISKPIRQDVLIKTIFKNWNTARLGKEAQSKRLKYAS